jgi:hypothetical protein
MNNHPLPRALPLLAICATTLLSIAVPASAQTPFACTGEAYIIQDASAQLTEIDQTTAPFTFVPIGGPAGFEVNNLGFNRADGLLYAAHLLPAPANLSELVRIDSTGTIFGLGTPAGLPALRYAAGDVAPDGATLYLNTNGVGTLYRVALPALTVTSVAITGATGTVFDWAVNPTNGNLYGGDQTGGQLAVLNPTTGVRTDSAVAGCAVITPTCTEASFPAGTAYGGAWFNAAGRLFLYRNTGTIYEIDLTGAPIIVGTQSGPGSTNNDGAACIQDVIGVAKHMSHPSMGFPDPITIDYTFENLSAMETLSNLSAIDDLTAVFGTRATGGTCAAPVPAGADWFFNSISSAPAAFSNPGYNGDPAGSAQLINQAPTQSLAAGASATAQVMITLCNQENATPPNPPGTGGPPYLFFNSVLFTGQNPAGGTFGDTSHDDGSTTPDPDPDGNGSPDERVPAQVPVELMEYTVD